MKNDRFRHNSNNHTNKGFTLAELLIVVAIIAVLVAIAIPIFNKQIEKSREAYDIATMRQAASAAIDLYYSGVSDKPSAQAAGLSWSDQGGYAGNNAYGAYEPGSGKFYKSRQALPSSSQTYGKGTAVDGGTEYEMGNPNGAYKADQDYTNAVVMVAIYPNSSPPRADIYWKNNKGNTNYVGGNTGSGSNNPKYCISIPLS